MMAGIARGSMEEAVRHVTDEMVDSLTFCGTPEEVAARMDAYRAAGVQVPAMNPVPPRAYYPLFPGHFPSNLRIPAPAVDAYIENVENVISKVPLV